MTSINKKEISLTFRGFGCDPEAVEKIFGCKATLTGKKGFPVRLGVDTLLKRSFVHYVLKVNNDLRLDEMIPIIIDHVGGVEHINTVRDMVSPEFVEINIVWPIKFSEDQESGYLPDHVISILAKIKCSLAFEFT